MKKILIIITLILAVCVYLAGNAAAREKILTYHSFASEDSTEVITVTNVKIKDLDRDRTSIVRQEQIDDCMVEDEFILDQDYDLVRWKRTCKEQGTNFSAKKKDGLLVIQGTLHNEIIDRKIDLEGMAVHVYPKYSLAKMALSDVEKFKFWTIRRDELKRLPMQAIHKGEGTLELNGKKMKAVKIYYSIVGKMREKFYNQNYYYRKSDGLFLKKKKHNGRIEILVKDK